jgi:class 3 adenylate cyclase
MNKLEFLPFEDLLAQYFEHPSVEREVEQRYQSRAAVMVVDFTAMARRTDEHGIIYALAVARAAERAMAPAVSANGGTLVKRVADTLFIVYSDPHAALDAARASLPLLAAFNLGRTDPIYACIGLGYGDVLIIPGVDIYGPEVNRAFVLGEDIAKGNEVLASEAFLAAVTPMPPALHARRAAPDREATAGFAFYALLPTDTGD